jgi:hypothetical protein
MYFHAGSSTVHESGTWLKGSTDSEKMKHKSPKNTKRIGAAEIPRGVSKAKESQKLIECNNCATKNALRKPTSAESCVLGPDTAFPYSEREVLSQNSCRGNSSGAIIQHYSFSADKALQDSRCSTFSCSVSADHNYFLTCAVIIILCSEHRIKIYLVLLLSAFAHIKLFLKPALFIREQDSITVSERIVSPGPLNFIAGVPFRFNPSNEALLRLVSQMFYALNAAL